MLDTLYQQNHNVIIRTNINLRKGMTILKHFNFESLEIIANILLFIISLILLGILIILTYNLEETINLINNAF